MEFTKPFIQTKTDVPPLTTFAIMQQHNKNIKEQQEKHLRAFIAGRESIDILSKRENEVIDCFFNKGMNDFRMIATLLKVSPSAIETYYDRAMDKLMNMDFEL